jgi:predicted nuclease of predicted toxin-antitoxin system
MSLIIPAQPPKLYLDENVPNRVATELRKSGYAVSCPQEVNMLAKSDLEQFEFAVTEQSAIVTVNFKDFIELNNQYLLFQARLSSLSKIVGATSVLRLSQD